MERGLSIQRDTDLESKKPGDKAIQVSLQSYVDYPFVEGPKAHFSEVGKSVKSA